VKVSDQQWCARTAGSDGATQAAMRRGGGVRDFDPEAERAADAPLFLPPRSGREVQRSGKMTPTAIRCRTSRSTATFTQGESMKSHLAAAMASLLFVAAGLAHADTPGAPMQVEQTLNANGYVDRGASAVTLLDSFTGAPTLTTTSGSPRTFMSSAFSFSTPGPEVDITEMTVFIASTAVQTYSNGLQIQVQFWDSYDSANATAIFSNPAGSVQTFTVPGPVSLAANATTQVNLTLASPIRLSSLTNKGISFNYQGDNGAGFASVDSLTTLIAAEGEPGTHPALAVGTNAVPFAPDAGFYRNVANQTNFNHPNTDRRTFAGLDNIRLAVQLRGFGSVPVTLQSFDVE
jgi:hypothetical protein